MILYNSRSTTDPQGRILITKFDKDLNIESHYLTSPTTCECPAGQRQTCRHREMYPAILQIIDTEWFYCFDDRTVRDMDGKLPDRITFTPMPPLPTGEPSDFRLPFSTRRPLR